MRGSLAFSSAHHKKHQFTVFTSTSGDGAKHCHQRVCISVCLSAPLTYLNKSSAVAEMGDRLATIYVGRKVGAAVPLSVGSPPVGGAVSPSNTMWPGPRPTSVPSDILIHPTVWPQYTNVIDRETDRKDNSPIAYRANRFTNGGPKTTYGQTSQKFSAHITSAVAWTSSDDNAHVTYF